MAILKCENLSFAYDGVKVFEDLSFTVNEGDIVCIVGENGVGKSTLVKGILGLKKPSEGTITFADGVRSRVGYLPQQVQTQDDFPASVYEVVLSGRLSALKKRFFYSKEDKKTACECLEKLGMLHLKNKNCGMLSGGQKQRMLLARALCAADKLLLLDEPTASLDPKATEEFYSVISELGKKEKMTMMIVSHDVKNAFSIATHILHISYEGSLFFGSTQDYINSEVGKAYLGIKGRDMNA